MLDKIEDVDMTEALLIKKAKEGDHESFEALILSCKESAYNIALRFMKNEEDALDATQESFIKIYKNLSKFNEQSKFQTWVYRIVVNTCKDMLRKNKNVIYIDAGYKNEDEEDMPLEIPDKGPGPEEVLERKSESQFILKCLDMLSDEQREVIILRDMRGLPYEEIADILECSIGTIKSKISRARQKFKEIYFMREQN